MKKRILFIYSLFFVVSAAIAQSEDGQCCQGTGCNPSPPPSTDHGKGKGPEHIGSYDPNDLIPPASECKRGWTRRDAPLQFTIRFENDPNHATAAAQRVEIRLPISAKADLNSFELSDYGFGEFYYDLSKRKPPYQKRHAIRAGVGGVNVQVNFELDVANRRAVWVFESIDALTGLPPTDPLAGFLPVNDSITHRGEGFVVFSYTPNPNTQTFDTLATQAEIIFDTNPSIRTPTVKYVIDADAPQSRVTSARAMSADTVRVRWGGTDVGCGLKNYTVFVSENNAPFKPWLVSVSDTVGDYPTTRCAQYQFISVARDSVGNAELTPAQPDLTYKGLSTDTVRLITCNAQFVGTQRDTIRRIGSCDSVVIRITALDSNNSITRLQFTTCRRDSVRTDTLIFHRATCDSLVIRTFTLTPSDTTRFTTFTCYLDSAGIFTTVLRNRAGCDSVLVKTVTYRPAAKPTIIRNYDTLTASLAIGYQWFRNDTLLVGATNRSYKTLLSGNYKVEITDLNGCKMKSDSLVVILVNIVYNCPALQKNIGDPCNDGNPNTNNDKIQTDCTCKGTLIATSVLTIACPPNLEITIPQGATYTNASWNEPIANSNCSISGGSNTCTSNVINGFTFLGELNGHQYFMSNILANWRDAKSLCINNGGYLAAITSQAENTFLKSKLQDMVFIGLNDEQTEGNFQWANGEISTYTNWSSGQPAQSPQALSEDFVVFQNWDGKWDDVNGLVAKRVLLERNCNSGVTPPPTVQQISGISNGAIFQMGTSTIVYEAKDACGNLKTCNFTVTVKQTPTTGNNDYCVSRGNAPWQAWIGRVRFKQINQQSSKEGYGNFKGSVATVNTNEIVPIEVMPNFSYTQYNGFVRVWIDFNGDKDFDDAGEMLLDKPYQGGNAGSTVVPITGNITIPATAKLATTTMRVSFRQDIAPTPCAVWSNSYGEVEDYSVTIGSNFQALVSMGNLKVQLIEDQSRLDWIRRSDSVSYFEVEKSANGHDFVFLEQVAKKPQTIYHQLLDRKLLEGDNYYRLKIVQTNGQIVYTPNQHVFYEKLLDFTIFPNPANDEAWVDLKHFENRTIEIIISDVAGKMMLTETVTTATRYPHRLDLSEVKSGAYFVTLRTAGKRDIIRKLSVLK